MVDDHTCGHDAPFPSKMVILLEKLEEMIYLRYCADQGYKFPLSGKPIDVVVHGGQTEEAPPYYRKALLEPLADAFAAVQMNVIGADSGWLPGVAFGIQRLLPPEDSICVTIEHDGVGWRSG